MKSTFNKVIAGLIVLAVLGSCKAKKLAEKNPAATNTAVPAAGNNAEKLKSFAAAQATYKTFSGRAKARLGIDGKDNDVTITLRIASGQKIWASVTAIAGIEVARALITPDSIRILNKLQGKYIAKPFSFVHSFSSDQVDFAMLESLLVGNYIGKFVNEQSQVTANGDNTVQIDGKSDDLIYSILFGANGKPTKESLNNQAKGQNLDISNDNFMDVSSRIFPGNILINSQVKAKKIQLVLNFTRIELDQNLQFPFTVSDKYSRAN